MNRRLGVLSATLISSIGPLVAHAQQEADVRTALVTAKEPGKASIAAAVTISATVEAIDLQQRKVVLKGPRGNLKMLDVGPEVGNLERLKVGDLVVAAYGEALTLTLRKGGKELRSRREITGGTPASSGVRQVEITADVIAVYAKTQTVSLRGPRQTVDLAVRDPEQFKLIKIGDQIQAVYTEAAVVSIVPTNGAPAQRP